MFISMYLSMSISIYYIGMHISIYISFICISSSHILFLSVSISSFPCYKLSSILLKKKYKTIKKNYLYKKIFFFLFNFSFCDKFASLSLKIL